MGFWVAQRELDLDALRRLHTELAAAELREAIGKTEGSFRLDVARSLVARNDIAGLSIVANALLQPAGLSESMVLNLSGSLAGLRDPRAIPSLIRLLGSGNADTRLYSAIALRQTRSPAPLRPLSQLLNDPNSQTRDYAVVGMGEITHQDEWTPAINEFDAHEDRYLAHWRMWAGTDVK